MEKARMYNAAEVARLLDVEEQYEEAREVQLRQQLKESYANIMNEANYTPKENVNNNGESTE